MKSLSTPFLPGPLHDFLSPAKLATSTLFASMMLASVEMTSAQLIAHEPFEDPALGDAGGDQGFQTGSTWEFAFGRGTSQYLQDGLTYVDVSGNELVTSGGAVMLSTTAPFDNFRRTLETEIPGGGNENYWISFLVRRDSPLGGDCFWSSGGADHGAFGLQGDSLKLVNGDTTGISLDTGFASLIVVNFKSNTNADVWIDPEDLSNPGLPFLQDGVLNGGGAGPVATASVIFGLNHLNSGVYTIDEFRYGASFADVAPFSPVGDPELSTPTTIDLELSPEPSTFEVIVTNIGATQDLIINGINFTGSESGLFSSTTMPPITIPPGSTNFIPVTFTPNGFSGPVSANVELSSNDAQQPVTMIGLNGLVRDPEISVPPIAFTPIIEGAAAVSETFSISNLGQANALNITDLSFSGPDSALFSLISPTLPFTVPADSSVDIIVQLDPTGMSFGTLAATMEITNNDLGQPDGTQVSVTGKIEQEIPTALVYESFSSPDFGASSGTGFEAGSSWVIDPGSVSFEQVGLTYTDSSGKDLATSGGAMKVVPVGTPTLTRTYASTIPPGGNPDYWISFLIRSDADQVGDAFWTPNGGFDRGAIGFQQAGLQIRLVNGDIAPLFVPARESILVVANLKSDTATDIWINPNLTNPGAPTLENGATGGAVVESPGLRFQFNDLNSGQYTIDEFRYGPSFAAVAPELGNLPIEITNFELVNGELMLTWTSTPNRNYSLQTSLDLSGGIDGNAWIEVDDAVGASDSDRTTSSLGSVPADTIRFYRVVELP